MHEIKLNLPIKQTPILIAFSFIPILLSQFLSKKIYMKKKQYLPPTWTRKGRKRRATAASAVRVVHENQSSGGSSKRCWIHENTWKENTAVAQSSNVAGGHWCPHESAFVSNGRWRPRRLIFNQKFVARTELTTAAYTDWAFFFLGKETYEIIISIFGFQNLLLHLSYYYFFFLQMNIDSNSIIKDVNNY